MHLCDNNDDKSKDDKRIHHYNGIIRLYEVEKKTWVVEPQKITEEED